MKFIDWERFKGLRRLLATDRPEPFRQAERIVAMQRDVVLPSKAGVILVVLYYLFYSGWLYEAPTVRSVVQDTLKNYFLAYILCNAVGAGFFLFWRRFPPGLFKWLAFTMGLLDGLFVAALTMVTDGFNSNVFWVFPGLIVINALSIPLAMPQLFLNLLLSLFFLSAGLLAPLTGGDETAMITVPGRSATNLHGSNQSPVVLAEAGAKPRKAVWSDDTGGGDLDIQAEPFFLRVALLWLLTVCCYGAQVLLERQRVAVFEAGEFAARENQLRSAGRLAAEFAHQIKNPLAIINNAAFSLQRAARAGKPQSREQIEIIQEEVARADKVITQIMGYAQLSEGRVEKLNLVEELDRAIAQVFPPVLPTGIRLRRDYGRSFPPLFMQRGHLSDIFVNLLLNAREAMGDKGEVRIAARAHGDHSVEVSVRDHGPGIPPEKIERVFEAYYTTKEKGTGLGLAIVKHNAELYGATVRAESELGKGGKGAKFTVIFPAKALMKFST